MFSNDETSKFMRSHLGGIQLHFTKSNPVCNMFMINYLLKFSTNFCRMAGTTATCFWDWTLYNMWQHLDSWIGFPKNNVPTSDVSTRATKNKKKLKRYYSTSKNRKAYQISTNFCSLSHHLKMNQTSAYRFMRIPHGQRVTGNWGIINIQLYSKGKRAAGKAFSFLPFLILPPLLQEGAI